MVKLIKALLLFKEELIMKKRTKLIFLAIEAILLVGTIIFTNDWVREHTSSKIAPVLVIIMFIMSSLTLLLTKTKD